MVSQSFTTELYETELTTVLLDTTGYIASELQTHFVAHGLLVTVIEAEIEVVSRQEKSLENAYRIVVSLSSPDFSENIQSLLEYLSRWQQKLCLVFPILSGGELEIQGEIPYFYELQTSQQAVLRACNTIVPQATFIFGQDVCFEPGTGLGLDLYTQFIQNNLIYIPSISITPITATTFYAAVIDQVLHPVRVSTVIMGRTRSAYALLQRVAHNYESYYFGQIELQQVRVRETATLPFTAKELALEESEEAIAGWYARQLPSPDKPSFFQEQTQSWFGITSPNKPDINQHNDVFLEEQEAQHTPEIDDSALLPAAVAELDLHTQVTLDNHLHTEPVSISMETPPRMETAAPFNITTEVQRIFAQSREEKQQERITTLHTKKTTITKKSRKKTALFYGGLAFTGIGLGILVLMAIFTTSVHFLKSSLLTVLSAEKNGQIASEQQYDRLVRFSQIVAAQTKSYTEVVSLPQLEEAEQLLIATAEFLTAEEKQTEALEAQKKLVSTILGRDEGAITQLAEKKSTESLAAYTALSAFERALRRVSFPQTALHDEILEDYANELAEMERSATAYRQLQPLLGKLFAEDQKRTYAVVFQNNQELRPTGGFIDAVAFFTLQGGSIIDHEIYTSYEIHDKLPGEIKPPPELVAATGESVFFFHDINWNPDFPKTAEQLSWFVEKSHGKILDGVVTVDLDSIAAILEATGPVEMPEYNEVITSKNLHERMEFHSEVVLVETTDKVDYRKLLYGRVIDKIMSVQEEKTTTLLAALYNSFQEQEMLASLRAPEEQTTLQSLGWTGALVLPRCPSEFAQVRCIVDHAMQVEANVGATKANHYLKRSIVHTVLLSPTEARHERVLSLQNTSPSNAWPKGRYKTYVRVYIPESSTEQKVLINGIAVNPAAVTITRENGLVSLGFLTEVPIQSTSQVVVTYVEPLSLESTEPFSYLFFNREQPGNGITPFTLRIQHDPLLRPEIIASEATIAGTEIIFSKPDDDTSLYGVKFTQAN